LVRGDSLFHSPVPSLWLLYARRYVRESKKIQSRGVIRKRLRALG